jgi:hypothetical protein
MVDLGTWTQAVHIGAEQGQRAYADIAIVNAENLRVALGQPGFMDGNDFAPAGTNLADWSVEDGLFTGNTLGFRAEEEWGGVPVRVSLVGDITGDAIDDIAAHVGALVVGPGPLDREDYVVVPETQWMDGTEFIGPGFSIEPCDADADGQNDLCTSRGIDLGPVDGTPDLYWDPGVDLYSETLAIGKLNGDTVAFVGTPTGIVRIPVASLLATPGVVDLTNQPVWPAENITRLTTIDPDADGTSDLISCARMGAFTRVWLHTDFDSAPTELLSIVDGCTDLEPGDFDGDGQLELAVGYDSRITIVELDGTERFTHVGVWDALFDGLGSGIDSADVDGDGRDDLVAGADISRTLYLTLQAIP